MSKMLIDRALLEQALEALDLLDEYDITRAMLTDEAIEQVWATADAATDALRAALEQQEQATVKDSLTVEQPEQEPVANNPDPYHLSRILHELAGSASMCWEHVDRAGVFQSTQAADFVAAALAEIRQRMKDAPPRREWQGLTDEEIDVVAFALGFEQLTPRSVARAIEAALKERNHE